MKINWEYVTEFSQIYIDTKKEILGTDIKAFLNQKNFKADEDNKPRIFSNTMKMNKDKNSFKKVFSLYVIIGKTINVLLGLFKQERCYMIIIKKLFIITMQL